MRPRFKAAFISFLAVISLTAFQGPAHAGAWLQEKGHGLLILSATMLSGDKIFDAAGRSFSIPRYNRFDADAWLEYGLTDRFTLVLQPALRSVRVAKPYNLRYTGLGDSSFGVRIGLWSSGDTVFSLQPWYVSRVDPCWPACRSRPKSGCFMGIPIGLARGRASSTPSLPIASAAVSCRTRSTPT